MSPSILFQILEEVRGNVPKGGVFRVVFDLDSTLFEVTPRNQKILEEFISSEHLNENADLKSSLERVKFELKDHGLESAIRRAGVVLSDEELRTKLIQFWRERFFSDSYLDLDKPFEGAVEFVRELYDLGAYVHYLTGRDIVRMGVGTPSQLKKWQFPFGDMRSQLTMKPQKGMDDSEFKVSELKKLSNVKWFFENEPKIIHHVESEIPNLKIVFFESSHSGKALPKSEWKKIHHFKR